MLLETFSQGKCARRNQDNAGSHLPNEILSQVLSDISSEDSGTLAAFCMVSKRFNSIGHTKLWRKVKLGPTSTGAGNQDRNADSMTRWNEDQRKTIKHLSVIHHTNDWCKLSHTRHLDLPNIEILEIKMQDGFGNFHHVTENSSNTLCPLMKQLRPKTMIIRNATWLIVNLQCKGLAPRAWSEVETLIFVAPYVNTGFYERKYPYCHPTMPKLRRVFWIFDPTIEANIEDTEFRDSIQYHLLSVLTLRYPNIPITIVNVGPPNLYPVYSRFFGGRTFDGSEQIFRYWMDYFYQHEDDQPAGIEKKKQKLVRFISLNRFLEEERWKEWFEDKEIRIWKNSLAIQENHYEKIQSANLDRRRRPRLTLRRTHFARYLSET
ncbi:uncharacterized protein I206_101850 [Kwoniella pini CBS 10737]|uniref:F-box domain-containing protein n=1 Tax=Kwoniella pini CBS 10737 TaxID=1296096 RepID=A0A1B9HVJ0_9TREE|nr:uncharacterized protein I206_07059 [Kwoniella pini CBS 10737]OCF47281.1 hypothetical protein I206_07059 [Kwoniella pini CBS 10737]